MEYPLSVFPLIPSAINIPSEYKYSPVSNTCHVPTEVLEFLGS